MGEKSSKRSVLPSFLQKDTLRHMHHMGIRKGGDTTSCFETSYGHSPHASMSNPQFIKIKTASIGVLTITLRPSHIIVCKNLGFLQSIAKYGHPCFTIISTSVKYQIIITVLNLLNLSRLQCIYISHFVSVFYSIHICKKHAISNFKL